MEIEATLWAQEANDGSATMEFVQVTFNDGNDTTHMNRETFEKLFGVTLTPNEPKRFAILVPIPTREIDW